MLDNLTEDLRRSIDRVNNEVNEYEEFEDWLSESEEEWEEFTLQEKDAFRQAFSRFVKYTREPINPSSLSRVRSDLKAAFRQPVREAIRDRFYEIGDELDLDLSESEINTLLSEFDSIERQRLIEKRRKYTEFIEVMQEEYDPIRDWFRDYLSRDKSRLLEPGDDLLPTVNSVRDIYQSLKIISENLEGLSWTRSLNQREIGYFSADWLETELHDPSETVHEIEKLEKAFSAFSEVDIDISPLLSDYMSDFTSSPRTEPVKDIQELSHTLLELVDRLDLVKIVDRITRARAEKTIAVQTESINKALGNLKHSPYVQLSKLSRDIDRFYAVFENWADSTHEYWVRQASIASVLVAEFDCPEPDYSLDSTEFEELLFEDPERAITQIGSLREYIQEQRAELEDEISEESVDLLTDLISNDSVPVSRYSNDAVSQLDERISLSIIIDESE